MDIPVFGNTIQIMYARVTRPLEQRAPWARAIYSKGRLRQTNAPYQQNVNKRYFYLQFFRTALTGKQKIASHLNKDHRATYHQGEVSKP